jgi:hypothetical protein
MQTIYEKLFPENKIFSYALNEPNLLTEYCH